jgi:tetratricopeptide (TPR) repeat protein
LLQAIADRSNDELQRGLARLHAAGFIYEARSLPELEFSFKHALTHEVAYRSLLRSTKQRYHERLARSLISRFPTIAETRPELVAHHLGETEAAAEALIWWERAGKRATDRSAHLDALGYYRRALALLEDHPAMAADHSHELRIRVAMYGPLTATTGYGSDAMEKLAARVRTIVTRGTDRELIRRAMWAQFGFFVARGPLATALHFAEQLRELTPPDAPDWWVVSNEAALVDIYCNMGEYRLAAEAAKRGFPLYDMDRHNPKVVESVQDRGVALLSMYAAWLGVLGYNDQAELLSQRSVALARRVAHPYTLAWALFVRLAYFGIVGRTAGYGEALEEMHAVAVRYGFALALARVTAAKGWELVLEGRPDEGIPFMRDGVASIQATGGRIGVTTNLQRLADGCIRAGRLSEARDALDGAFANMREYGDYGIETKLQRAKGDLILAESVDKAAAEACYRVAIDKARRTEARLYELQASTRLAQLWHTRGKTQEARALLSRIYGRFTEGFDSLDLVNTRAALAAMR